MARLDLDEDDFYLHPATARVVDFRHIRKPYYRRDRRGLMRVVTYTGYAFSATNSMTTTHIPTSDAPRNPRNGNKPPYSMRDEQQKKRLRRAIRRGERITREAWAEAYKPVEDWDMEELARGRPRSATGSFQGRPPGIISREVHERAMERFKTLIRQDMSVQSITALKTIQLVLESEEVDNRGRPIVPTSSKMDAAKFLLEHIVGKPVQPTQNDISVKLQGILGAVMVNPTELQGQYAPAHIGTRGDMPALPGGLIYDAELVDDEDEDDAGD